MIASIRIETPRVVVNFNRLNLNAKLSVPGESEANNEPEAGPIMGRSHFARRALPMSDHVAADHSSRRSAAVRRERKLCRQAGAAGDWAAAPARDGRLRGAGKLAPDMARLVLPDCPGRMLPRLSCASSFSSASGAAAVSRKAGPDLQAGEARHGQTVGEPPRA